jgi:hypothetical protein
MSGIRPTMVSAPRIVLYSGSTPIAYAIGLSLNVGVNIVPVYTFGHFEAVSLEPVMYAPVTGVFQIIRLSSSEYRQAQAAASPGAVNSISENTDNSVITQAGLFAQLDPASVLASATFDLNVYMKHVVGALDSKGQLLPNTGNDNATDLIAFLKIQDCRITNVNTNLAMGALINQPLSYTGLLAINSTLATANQEQLDFFTDNQTNGNP